MPRNKTAKRNAARTTTKNAMDNYQHIEKEFMGIPGKFAIQVKKDIQAQRQKENKLKAAFNKSKKAVKIAEAKLKAATKNKQTAAGKKHFNVCKKMHATVTQHHAGLSKQMSEMTHVIHTLVSKHAKLAALSKYLNTFNKEWANQTKKTAADKATKAAKPKAKRKLRVDSASVVKEEVPASVTQHDDFEAPANYNSEANVSETENA